jgi:hypothetical protein
MTQHSHPNATKVVDTADFSARDENLRCLSYGVLRKLAGLPRDLFADYWRDVLGPLCARTIFHRTTGPISGLCRTVFAAWTSCSTAPRKSASPTSTA